MMSDSEAAQNWRQIRDYLCERIQRQRLALTRLGNEPSDFGHAPDGSGIASAAELIELLQSTEHAVDRAFQRVSNRPLETTSAADRHDPDLRNFRSRS